MEVLWKMVMGILNRRPTAAIQFHDTLHGFCTGRCMGATSLKSNLPQQLIDMSQEVLHKSYVTLDRRSCLDILAVYGVILQSLSLLRRYWDRLTMVAMVGGYFWSPSKGKNNVTRGGPLSPTIFNVVVDVVHRHWVSVAAATERVAEPGTEGIGQDIQLLTKYLYADDGLLASPWKTRLQWAFNVMTELFGRAGMRTDVVKMVNMARKPCRVIGGNYAKSYGLRMTIETIIHQERLR